MAIFKRLLPFGSAISLLFSGVAVGADWTVVSCNDGDTCRLKNEENLEIKLRLAGVDAPEFAKRKKRDGKKPAAQPFSQEAKEFLNGLVQGKKVTVKTFGTDPFNRNLGEIYLGSTNVNLRLVEEGLAETYRGKPPKGYNLEPFLQAEAKAKKLKKGIWSLSDYQSPSDFRRASR